MTTKQLDEQLQGRNKNGRKIANNTYAERRGDAIAIRLHSTDILTYKADGSVEVNTGGWKTSTTKARLNEYLPNGYSIYQERGVWYWIQHNGQHHVASVFTDGDSISATGELIMQATPDKTKAEKKLRNRINAYAKLCADVLPLEAPGAGDCFYCAMTTDKGETLGDTTKDTSHLESHLDEGYVVPSLVYHAMEERGYAGKIPMAAAFGQPGLETFLDMSRDAVKRAVRKYMFKRFGMAA